MADDFDPYRKWLGIPASEQPPNHYRLLGIAPLEDDPDVISNAADRQMAHVRTFQSGKNAAWSQTLLNELSAAKGCLLDARRKARYDADLKDQLEPHRLTRDAPPPAPRPPPPAPPRKTRAGAPSTSSDDTEGDFSTDALEHDDEVPTGSAVDPPALSESAIPIESLGSTTSPTKHVRARRQTTSPLLSPLLWIVAGVVLVMIFIVLRVAQQEDDPPPRRKGNSDRQTRQDSGGKHRATPPRRTPPRDDSGGRPGNLIPPPSDPQAAKAAKVQRQRQMLESVRESLARRNMKEAQQVLDDVAFSRPTGDLRTRLNDVQTLHTYLLSFWKGVEKTISGLRPDDRLQYDGQQVVVVRRKQFVVTFDDGEKRFEVNVRKQSIRHVIGWAVHGLQNDAFSKLYVATFLAVDSSGNRDKWLPRARALWQQAAAEGQQSSVLARELDIDLSAPIQTKPLIAVPLSDIEPKPLLRFTGSRRSSDRLSPTDGPQQPERLSVPVGPDLASAKQLLVRLVGSDRLQARTTKDKRNLIRVLQRKARNEREDMDFHYVLLERIIDLGVELSDIDLICHTIDHVAGKFDIDALGRKQIRLARAIAKTSEKSALKNIHNRAHLLYENARQQRNFDVAARLARVVSRAARKVENTSLQREMDANANALEEYLVEKKKADQAAKRLQKAPQDANANSVYGQFLCLFNGDWEEGLPYLAKSGEPPYAELAAQDLEIGMSPDDRIAMADAWFTMGRRKQGIRGHQMLLRARHWLVTVEKSVQGRRRRDVRILMQEIDDLLNNKQLPFAHSADPPPRP